MALRMPSKLQSAQVGTSVTDLDLSNDGTRLAVALGAGAQGAPVEVRDTADGSVVASLGEGAALAHGVAIVKNDVYFTIPDESSSRVQLMRAPLKGGKAKRVAEYDDDEMVRRLARDESGRFLATLGATMDVWDLSSGEVARHLKSAEASIPVQGCFSADGRSLYLYGIAPGEVVQYDVAKGEEGTRWPAPQPYGEQVAVSRSGRYLACVGQFNAGIFLYDGAERIMQDTFSEGSSAFRVMFTDDESLMIDQARYVDLEARERKRMPDITAGQANASAWAWKAPVVAFGNTDGDLRWVRLEEG